MAIGSSSATATGTAIFTARSRSRALRPQARQVGFLRLLLLAIAFGIAAFFFQGHPDAQVGSAQTAVAWLLASAAAVALALLSGVSLAREQWQLAFHLVFDLVWVGLLLFYTGGVASPGVVLLFAVVLIGNLALPGVARFLMPALAALMLAGNALVYVTNAYPFPNDFIQRLPALADTGRILGNLAIQVAALFLVDLLGQLLAHRLHEQRIFTGELLEQIGEGVLAVDLTGVVVYVNGEAIRLLGLPPNVRGRPLERVLGAGYAEVLTLLRAKGMVERAREVAGRRLVLRSADLIGRSGQRLGRTLMVADQTRLRSLEDNARRAEHLASLGEMAAGIAHEVRNPLTSLRGCAQELAEMSTRLGHGDAAALATIMVSESDRLARIVGDFLALSRLRPPKRVPTPLGPVFAELQQLSTRRSDLPTALSFVAEVDPDCPLALVDPDQLRQILNNLVNNSLDALREVSSPRLHCLARAAPDDNALGVGAVEISVEDNGSGISPELKERVFTPFFSTKSQGTGLGLSLVSRIVREHEGVLRLDSNPGAGTTIVILLPINPETRTYVRTPRHDADAPMTEAPLIE